MGRYLKKEFLLSLSILISLPECADATQPSPGDDRSARDSNHSEEIATRCSAFRRVERRGGAEKDKDVFSNGFQAPVAASSLPAPQHQEQPLRASLFDRPFLPPSPRELQTRVEARAQQMSEEERVKTTEEKGEAGPRRDQQEGLRAAAGEGSRSAVLEEAPTLAELQRRTQERQRSLPEMPQREYSYQPRQDQWHGHAVAGGEPVKFE